MRVLFILAACFLLLGQASAEDEEKKEFGGLCNDDVIDPTIDKLNIGVKEDCYMKKVIANYQERYLKRTDYNENSTELPEAKKELAKALVRSSPKPGKEVTVKLWTIAVDRIYASETKQGLVVVGSMVLSWEDERLSYGYGPHTVPESSFALSRESSIWRPDLSPAVLFTSSQKRQQHFGHSDMLLHRNGTVFRRQNFYIKGACVSDWSDYPQDTKTCCAKFQSRRFPNLLRVELKAKAEDIDFTRYIHTARFKAQGGSPDASTFVLAKEKESEGRAEHVSMCFAVQRRGAVMAYMTAMPTAVAAFIAVVIPLFSGWTLQILSKFFALIFLFLTINFNAQSTVLLARHPPRFILLTDFLIWTTVVSITVTVILRSLAKSRAGQPQPELLEKAGGYTKGLFFGLVAEKKEDGWEQGMVTGNNVHLVLVTAVYVIGAVLILCA